MPRNVRPAWLVAGADGRTNDVALGPRSRDGWLWGRITLRKPSGSVSDDITLQAREPSTAYGAVLTIGIPASFVTEVETDARGTFLIIRSR
jgi:hypothetical protein